MKRFTSGRWRLWYKYCINLREQSPLSTGVLTGPASCIPGCASGNLNCGCRDMPAWDCWLWGNCCDNCCCCRCWMCANFCCRIKAWSCGLCWPWRWRELWPWSSRWIICCCRISSCLISTLGFFWAGNATPASVPGCDVALDDLRFCICSWGGLCCMMDPSMTDEPDMLLDENDIGEAGRRMNESAFMLVLCWNWAPPESDELQSVTKELTPILGPEEFAELTGMLPFMSLATNPRLERGAPDMEVTNAATQPSPCRILLIGKENPWKLLRIFKYFSCKI